MWTKIVTIVACLAGLSAAIEDLSNLCEGHNNGDVVANPFDCQSYFVCNIVPKLRFCENGLHFDAKLKLCNWPEYANCVVRQPQPTPAGDVPDSLDFGWFAPKPRPTFVAIDVDTGLQTDPLAKFNPKHVECRHFGAYFLPHPRSCQRYFLCAYGHLHQHYCGRGAMWNYKKSVCELAAVAECYENTSNAEQQIEFETEQAQDFTMTDVSGTTAALPATSTPSNPATVCFVVDYSDTQTTPLSTIIPTTTVTTTTTTPIPTTIATTLGPTVQPSGTPTQEPLIVTTPMFTGTTIGPSTTTTPFEIPTHDPQFLPTTPPTTLVTTTRVSTAAPMATSAARPDTNILECPRNREAYFPHKRDCSKYFICIVGMPVLTSCPDGLYWNQKAEFCDAPKNVDCRM